MRYRESILRKVGEDTEKTRLLCQDLQCFILQPGVVEVGVKLRLSCQHVAFDPLDLGFGIQTRSCLRIRGEGREILCDAFVQSVSLRFGLQESLDLIEPDRESLSLTPALLLPVLATSSRCPVEEPVAITQGNPYRGHGQNEECE